MNAGYQCAGCGEWNEVSIDETAGGQQSYVEDCQVCCRPNVLMIRYDAHGEDFLIDSELE
jgi:hypothetical protein